MDMIGKRFGRLTVIRFDRHNGTKMNKKWVCACDCGKQTSVYQSNLLSGNTKSCGCLKRENMRRIGKQNGKRNHEGDQQ